MLIAVILIIVGTIAVIAVFNARAKNKDNNGPMNNN
jgi:heme/copper-type cytochrome/quinol oxidase subunit 2